ncbi:hypothetical protein ACHQM5_001233 [Ranunculus cassubicifolius]
MEVALQSSCLMNKPPPSLHYSNIKTRLIVKATTDSSPSSSSPEEPEKPITKTSLGFGSSSTVDDKKRKKSKGRVIRRTPLEKPAFLSAKSEVKVPKQDTGETVFILAWIGLGSLIIIEGLVLSASGFLPEEWDNFFTKYLYPAFTPTVFLFVAGTVVYGVLKYKEGEKMKS